MEVVCVGKSQRGEFSLFFFVFCFRSMITLQELCQHRDLISRLAKQLGVAPLMVTYDPHIDSWEWIRPDDPDELNFITESSLENKDIHMFCRSLAEQWKINTGRCITVGLSHLDHLEENKNSADDSVMVSMRAYLEEFLDAYVLYLQSNPLPLPLPTALERYREERKNMQLRLQTVWAPPSIVPNPPLYPS
jgi:hypothetical protein